MIKHRFKDIRALSLNLCDQVMVIFGTSDVFSCRSPFIFIPDVAVFFFLELLFLLCHKLTFLYLTSLSFVDKLTQSLFQVRILWLSLIQLSLIQLSLSHLTKKTFKPLRNEIKHYIQTAYIYIYLLYIDHIM